MKQTIMFGFITLGVFLFVSSALAAPERPVYDISGNWYVVATKGYKATLPKCWTLDITPLESNQSFSAVLSARYSETLNFVETTFDINRFDVGYGYGGDQTQWFTVKGHNSEGETIDNGPLKLHYNAHDPVVALEDFQIEGVELEPWGKLFISRRSDITPDMVPLANSFLDNSDCWSQLDDVEIY